MNNFTLEKVLQRLPPSRPCLLGNEQAKSVRQTLDQALAWRVSMPEAKDANIALFGLTPLELILALIALDGYATQILLLPPSLDSSIVQNLMERAGTTHVLSSGDSICRQVSPREPASAIQASTQWVLATSGTTGTPKLIEHQLATLTRTVRADPVRGKEFIWGLLYDPNRFAGLQVILQALFSGSSLVLPEYIDFNSQVASLLSYPVNALSATPTLWRKLLMDGQITRLPLRQLTLGGETADQLILDALKTGFPKARIIHIYASTEAGTGFAVQDGRAGFPITWLNNPDHAPSLKINANQHLLIKPNLLPNGAEINTRLDGEGYLDTQDVVRVDEDRVFFIGRASGAINVGGNKVHPEILETYLRSINDVIDARVFAKSNSIMGQLVAAEVVLSKQAEPKALRQLIIQSCRRDLESWETPVLINFVNALKETAAGKRERLPI